MKTKFTKNDITIKSIIALDKRCDECYFGVECKNGNWNCNDKIKEWEIPDCVYDYESGKSRIYIKIENKLNK